MIITQLTAKNFGKHETISFSTHDSVVGIIGPNGSGKSTLLKLLQFLFTGLLEDKLDSYVRAGAKFCEGEARFIKNGQPGRIYRKVFASATPAKRELEWNGETTTRDTDVANRLAEIMGADKHAINNAVFIPQGDLDKILFGDQADREKLFTRLVNVAFLEKTVGVLDTKIKQESASTEDLTAVVDELRVQLAQAGGHVQDLDLEYRAQPDGSSELTARRRLLDLLQQEAQTLSRWVAASQAAQQHQTSLGATLGSAGYDSWEALQTREAELTTVAQRLGATRDRLVRGQHVRELQTKIAEELAQMEAIVATKQTRQEQLTAGLHGVDVSAARLLAQQLETRETLSRELATAEAATAAALAAYTEHSRTTCPEESSIEPLKPLIDELRGALGGVDLTLRTLKGVVGKATGDRCPCCDQHIDAEALSLDRLSKLEHYRERVWLDLSAKTQELDRLEKARRDWTVRTKSLSDAYLWHVKTGAALAARLAPLPTGDAAAQRERCNQLTQQQAELAEVTATLTQARERLRQLGVPAISAEDLQLAAAFSPAELQTCQVELARTRGDQQTLVNLRTTVSSLWQAKTKAEAAAHAAAQAHRQAESAVSQHRETQPCPPLPDTELPVRVAALEGQERARQECAGRLAQARQQLATLQKRDLELAERLHQNAIRMQVVEDLRRLRDTFSRSGLPMIYVEYQFHRLTTLAQRNLAEIGANFTVEVNSSRPVAFTFSRLDDAAGQGLDMSKLSGGQRVKLAIAFLLAVQQLLIPEVGLLVLDEPSTHLDEESVGALKHLLMSMAQTLQNAQHQVWVVDHHTDLMPAFGACLQLR